MPVLFCVASDSNARLREVSGTMLLPDILLIITRKITSACGQKLHFLTWSSNCTSRQNFLRMINIVLLHYFLHSSSSSSKKTTAKRRFSVENPISLSCTTSIYYKELKHLPKMRRRRMLVFSRSDRLLEFVWRAGFPSTFFQDERIIDAQIETSPKY